MIASLAAIREGKIVAKIEPVDGGEDQRAAFLALRRDVEVQLDRILKVSWGLNDVDGNSCGWGR